MPIVPPPARAFKVKMDGSYYPSLNQAFCGGLIRDSLSVPIAISVERIIF